MTRFARFVGVDWSGEAVARPRGIALAHCTPGTRAPTPLARPQGWSRAAVLDWLLGLATSGERVLIGIDFSPALPFVDHVAYFPGWSDSPADARGLWRLVDALSAGEPHLSASGFAALPEVTDHFRRQSGRETIRGALFEGSMGRLRATERACRAAGLGNAVSSFNLIGASQVGKSSLTGMRLLHALAGRVPIWPFDPIPAAGPLIVEIYTAVAARAAGLTGSRTKVRDGGALDTALAALGSAPHAPLVRYDDHVTDAVLAAAWLRRVGDDAALWSPPALTPALARTEGWTFGIA